MAERILPTMIAYSKSHKIYIQLCHTLLCCGYINNSYDTFLYILNTLRPKQNGRHFADDTFKYIFLKENVWI